MLQYCQHSHETSMRSWLCCKTKLLQQHAQDVMASTGKESTAYTLFSKSFMVGPMGSAL